MPHRGRAPVATCAGVEVLEGVELLGANAAAFGEQGGEFRRAGAEGLDLFQQHAMAGEGLAESAAKSHGVTFFPGALAQIVVGGQNLAPAGGEGGDRLAMAPAESGAADIARDTRQRVVVRRRPRPGRRFAPGAGRALPVLPNIRLPVQPYAIRHIVERRLLGLRARPALGQIGPDLGVGDRRLNVVVRPPVATCRGRGEHG